MPKKTLKAIIRGQNHYVVKVKANQLLLFEEMQNVCKQEPLETFTSTHWQKGRQEHRKVEVFRAQGKQKSKWRRLRTFLKVTRWGSRQGQAYERVGYYISDLCLKASEFALGIRRHWSIENSLHWTKDVVFKEDKCKARMGNGPAILSLLRGFAISVLAKVGDSTTEIMRLVTNKPDKIIELLE
jgi:predicted transposase YbfD/YdcC